MEFVEPITDPRYRRFTLKPIDPTYQILWDLYQTQEAAYWTAGEIDFSKDMSDFQTLTPDEQQFVKMVLAFFSATDMIVNFNLEERFTREITIPEAKVAYDFQKMMENTHSQIYSDMLINIIDDIEERDRLLNAFKTVPSIKRMSDWALEWIESDKSLAHRLIAFAIVEGVFFSGAFACIYWLKKQRSGGKSFMQGLIKSNEFIARDESLHVNFACALYSFIRNRVPYDEVVQIFTQANEISQEFMREAIQCKLIGMSNELMDQYINFISDRLLVMLGYEKIYHTTNPFPFMETIGMLSKDNFFENRPTTYQRAHNDDNKNKWSEFKILDDF